MALPDHLVSQESKKGRSYDQKDADQDQIDRDERLAQTDRPPNSGKGWLRFGEVEYKDYLAQKLESFASGEAPGRMRPAVSDATGNNLSMLATICHIYRSFRSAEAEDDRMIVILTGVPGCGKGKVIEFVKKKIDVSVLNFGDFMFRIAKESGMVKDRDDMRKKISVETSRAMQKKAAEAISSEIAKMGENVIVDTHCTILSPAGYFPGLPFEVLQRLKPHAILVREVSPASVLERREKDRKSGVRTKRDEEELSAIELQQQLNRCYAAAYSAVSGATLKVVIDREVEEYPYQNAELAAKALIEIFEFK